MFIHNKLIDDWINKAINIQQKEFLPEKYDIFLFSFSDMQLLANLAYSEANKLNINIVFSLVDNTGVERFYFSMQNSLLVSQQLAYQKAYSAVAMKMPTHQLYHLVQPDEKLYSLNFSISNISTIGGGFPCYFNQQLIAGIGVSGGTVEQDIQIVKNILSTFSTLRFAINLK